MALSGRGMCSRLARPHRSYFLSAGGSQYVIKSKASQAGTMPTATDAYAKLQNRKVFRSSDFAEVDIPSLWGPNDKAVVAFTRSMG